MLETRYRSCR